MMYNFLDFYWFVVKCDTLRLFQAVKQSLNATLRAGQVTQRHTKLAIEPAPEPHGTPIAAAVQSVATQALGRSGAHLPRSRLPMHAKGARMHGVQAISRCHVGHITCT